VGWYQKLAQAFGPDRPFLALQAAGLEDDRPPHASLEEMARAYVRELRAVQPHGPYHLAGWSLGGPLAFLMARELRGMGERVATLALLDPGLTIQVPMRFTKEEIEGPSAVARRAREACVQRMLLPAGDPGLAEAEATLRDALERMQLSELAPLSPVGLHRHVKVTEAQSRAQAAYRRQRYAGGATLFLAEDVLEKVPDMVARLQPQFGQKLEIHRGFATHRSLVLHPDERARVVAIVKERMAAGERSPMKPAARKAAKEPAKKKPARKAAQKARKRRR
jgi:thioesterase domain-containing protein